MEISMKLRYLEMDSLNEHEGVEKERLEALTKEIQRDGYLKKAIAVDMKSMVIIDGHHRLHALRRLGCKRIPACLFDYSSPKIVLFTWGENRNVTKEQVIAAALRGKKLPPRYTRHEVRLRTGETTHISNFEKDVNVPLDKLR